jgi:hypothetical protein
MSVRVFELSNYVKPQIKEEMGKEWVLNGRGNWFFQYVIDRYNGSPTNAALIDAYVDRIYGRGISIVNAKSNAGEYVRLLSILPKKDLRKICRDFYEFGSATLQIRYSKATKRSIAKIEHLERQLVAPNRINEKGEIDTYWVCSDWKNVNQNEPIPYPAFGTSKKGVEIYEIKPYSPGKTYFADPCYLPSLQYANLEEEIANFSVRHIQNGLSAGWIVNFNGGEPLDPDLKDKLELQVKSCITGSNNAGAVIVSFNDNKDVAPTIDVIESNGNHEQWEFWAGEARQQILVGHRVTTPMLFGVKDNTGLGNNANEMQEGNRFLEKYSVGPHQNEILDALQEIVQVNDIGSPLVFLPLEEEDEKEEKVEEKPKEEEVKLSSHIDGAADYLVSLGEEITEEWETIDEREVVGHTLSETQLNTIIELASTPPGDARKSSEQDTSLFKIRYKYAGSQNPEREFCQKLIKAGKIYRIEDLEAAENQVLQKGMGPNGTDTYSIFLYKGGVNCKHWWQRIIYLRKGNKRIGVNEARRMILELEPKDREAAKWEQNPKEVAQIAGPNNNHWKLN